MKRILIDQTVRDTEGALALIDVLQTEGMKNATQRIVVTGPGGQRGEIFLAQGSVYDIRVGDKQDSAALEEMLRWEIAEISIDPMEGPDDANLGEARCPVDKLLLELVDRVPRLSRTITGGEEDSGMATVEEQLGQVLQTMVDRLGGVDAAMLVDSEGFVVASYGATLGSANDVEMVGGITTSLLTMTTRVAGVLGTGKVDRVMLHGLDRHVFVSPAAPGVNLVTIARKDASLGLIFAELRNVGSTIEEVLGGK